MWHTINGGKTWERQRPGTRASLRAMHFLTPYSGWAVGRTELPGGGSAGVVLATSDGGLKWTAAQHEQRARAELRQVLRRASSESPRAMAATPIRAGCSRRSTAAGPGSRRRAPQAVVAGRRLHRPGDRRARRRLEPTCRRSATAPLGEVDVDSLAGRNVNGAQAQRRKGRRGRPGRAGHGQPRHGRRSVGVRRPEVAAGVAGSRSISTPSPSVVRTSGRSAGRARSCSTPPTTG